MMINGKFCVALIVLLTFLHAVFSPSIAIAQDRPAAEPEVILPEEVLPDDEVVYTLQIGDPAPFAGTLLSIAAAARLLTDLEFTQETCNLQISARVRLTEANMQLMIDTEHARFEALEYRHSETIRVRDEQIEFLTAQYRPRQWYESGEFWFGMGAIVGVIITVAAGYALGLAN